MAGKNTRKPVEKTEEVKVEAVETAKTEEVVEAIEETIEETSAKAAEIPVVEKDTQEAVKEAPEATVAKIETVVEEVKEKDVDVVGLKDHNCRIGGVVYSVRKDKITTVPQSIGIILQRANAVVIKG